jgi:hypothetical protein
MQPKGEKFEDTLNTATLFYENALHQASKVSGVC